MASLSFFCQAVTLREGEEARCGQPSTGGHRYVTNRLRSDHDGALQYLEFTSFRPNTAKCVDYRIRHRSGPDESGRSGCPERPVRRGSTVLADARLVRWTAGLAVLSAAWLVAQWPGPLVHPVLGWLPAAAC